MAKSVSIPIALSELKRTSLRQLSGNKKKTSTTTPLTGFVILVERSGDVVKLYGTAAERAGLSIGDEIVTINDMNIDGKKYEQVVEHIRECIRTKVIQLKVRRTAVEIPAQNEASVFNFDSSSSFYAFVPLERRRRPKSMSRGTTSSTMITDAYLVSVDKEHIKEVTKRLKKEYPELRTYDMESIAASAPQPTNFQRGSVRRPEAHELQERINNKIQRQKENDFLRTSMRQSKRLQALATSVEPMSSKEVTSFANPLSEVSGFENQCFAESVGVASTSSGTTRIAIGEKDEEDVVTTSDSHPHDPIELKEVIVSVERIASRLSELQGRESDVAMLRQFFAAPPIQAAIEQTAAAMKSTGKTGSDIPMTTVLNGATKTGTTSSGIGSDGSRTPSEASAPELESRSREQNVSNTERPSSEKRNVRVVTLSKDEDSYLGATVRNEENRIVVGRVVKGGVVEKLALFEEGDELLELNGVNLFGKQVGEICEILRNLKGEVKFVVASRQQPEDAKGEDEKSRRRSRTTQSQAVQHVRALFDYDPEDDVYVPCKELAMKFQRGDILHVLNTSDENWWQAYREGEDTTHSLAGLIPSSSFRQQVVMYAEEVERERDKRKGSNKKSKKPFCKTNGKDEIRRGADEEALPSIAVYSDLLTYEEVVLHLARTDRKRPIVLCGAEGVGCLKLRDKILENDRQRLASPVPYTSRLPKEGEIDGVHYHFVTKQRFQEEAKAGKFVEFGEYQKHWYGTSKSDIIMVIHRGKTCVMTLKAESLGAVRSGDVMPFIVFVAAPSLHVLRRQRECDGQFGVKDDDLKLILNKSKLIEQKYGHLFDAIVVNTDFEKSLAEMGTILRRLETEPQWVPATWL
ncbi:unnamed protein product [Caenorhabditis auriculariae]|uniref:Uncharacterized protein n=1 Tax=Caenorhabditis auriculariae TaxID=2777116 RepID=A0A8S1GUF3_9PELO|nr:unnamed protein product [Caenorhabditis auriculariae]